MEENAIQINGAITINVDVSVKNVMYVEKKLLFESWYNCKNGKYVASIMDYSAIICDEVIDVYAGKEAKRRYKL